MNGRILFILVLLLVFAIPLSATHALDNTVSEFSAISIDLEEVPFNKQELFDSNVFVLAVGLNKEHPINYIVLINGVSISYNNNVSQTVKNNNTIHGGVKRTNLRKH